MVIIAGLAQALQAVAKRIAALNDRRLTVCFWSKLRAEKFPEPQVK